MPDDEDAPIITHKWVGELRPDMPDPAGYILCWRMNNTTPDPADGQDYHFSILDFVVNCDECLRWMNGGDPQ